MRDRLVLAIGRWRVRTEGWENAEMAHPRWDRIVRWLDRKGDR